MKTQKMKRNKSSKITNTRSLTGSGGGRKRKTHYSGKLIHSNYSCPDDAIRIDQFNAIL